MLLAGRGLLRTSCFIQGIGADVIYSERRGQSQKPEEIYDLIEKLVPGGAPLLF